MAVHHRAFFFLLHSKLALVVSMTFASAAALKLSLDDHPAFLSLVKANTPLARHLAG